MCLVPVIGITYFYRAQLSSHSRNAVFCFLQVSKDEQGPENEYYYEN
jgi:hypothetical protein